MNIYEVSFFAECPVNGVRVKYDLTIQTGATVSVERLLEKVSGVGRGMHEGIADMLLREFGGSQTLVAFHHGVLIKTIRPHIAHWSREAAEPDAPLVDPVREGKDWAGFAEGRMG